jgi:hypothetical protein
VVLLTGTTLTAAALTIGAIYAVRTAADSNNLSSARSSLNSQSRPGDVVQSFCSTMRNEHQKTCEAIDGANAALQTDRTVRNVSLVVAGALGVVTLSTFFLWPGRSRTVVAPTVGPRYAGIGVQGRF